VVLALPGELGQPCKFWRPYRQEPGMLSTPILKGPYAGWFPHWLPRYPCFQFTLVV